MNINNYQQLLIYYIVQWVMYAIINPISVLYNWEKVEDCFKFFLKCFTIDIKCDTVLWIFEPIF